ncbi:MAG: EI24 domain-containing protein [Anaeromyxobacteraceae bacterium]
MSALAPGAGEGAPAVLATAPVGPAVASWRDLAPAVGWYAANGDAVPRPDVLGRALFGVAQVLRGARLVATDPALRRAALVPSLLTIVGCGVLAAFATGEATDGDRNPLPTFQAYLTTFVALSSMPPTLLQRMWVKVALEARRVLGMSPGEEAFAGVGHVRVVAHELVKAVRQAVVVSIGLAPLLGVVRALPFGKHEAAALAAAWAFYWVVIDAFELPIEVIPGPRQGGPVPWYARLLAWGGAKHRLLRPIGWMGRFLARLTVPWHEEVHETERRRVETLGFGLAVGALCAIPVLGLFFRSVAIVGATGLVRLDEAAIAGPPEASPPSSQEMPPSQEMQPSPERQPEPDAPPPAPPPP